jgi:U32 family peptidase
MPMVPAPHRPELLAPAGGPESLRAAVNNGADAVYLGVDRLNARRGAENFALEDLGEATRYAHLRGVKVYLTANVVIRPSEMDDALSLVDEAWASGVDAVILQDLGLARAVARELPDVRMHASTQINAHNTPTVAELERLGFSRVTLARELAIPEIGEIVGGSSIEAETFVHGALCFCYSGQCLLSSAVGGRSANRGMCAQPCRLPYELLDEKGKLLETPGATC